MPNAMRSWRDRTLNRMRGRAADRGANSIEYAGIVILVAGIILAIRALGLDAIISGAIANAVSAVLGG
ncbi:MULTISPECIES: hypothetical protein [unclassified Streptomyces]|uniref:hypothetical protein n=1 Tax=unclassified Streptomyces TaxID=2593676 RepID=UPI002DDA3C05|nr:MULTISPECIES: hypothetical protein [unclassified Streptomyces]WSA97129.1 hypothetical protein OIE63_14665 [Streptomyces sp. NBC_01795]WSB81557.1 hypothetical protein OHB04_15470 [Streptomyces sp. NBC_01775]WSS17688.1 hypothetical protein OG533_24475 [Streptomyces sp. NBC_01186]WSS46439.1 hypothetical protein OG220_25225 [Streptomyces sp. NBC_01187]